MSLQLLTPSQRRSWRSWKLPTPSRTFWRILTYAAFSKKWTQHRTAGKRWDWPWWNRFFSSSQMNVWKLLNRRIVQKIWTKFIYSKKIEFENRSTFYHWLLVPYRSASELVHKGFAKSKWWKWWTIRFLNYGRRSRFRMINILGTLPSSCRDRSIFPWSKRIDHCPSIVWGSNGIKNYLKALTELIFF